jgi:uncharacterized protein YwqG
MWDWIKSIFRGAVDTKGNSLQSKAVIEATVAEVLNRMSELALPAVALDFQPGEPVPDRPVSSIGGMPSLPSDGDWPVDGKGKPLLFLAQLNFADLPKLDGYPTDGVMSFFVGADDLNGCDFPSRNQIGFRTLYFDDPGRLRRIPNRADLEYDPFGKVLRAEGAPLTGEAMNMRPMAACYPFDELASAIYKDLGKDADRMLFDAVDSWKTASLYFGGHPDFTQQDFRYKAADRKYDRVLLQIGFIHKKGREWEICWGDAGEATFMLSEADLQNKNFAASVYNWDCC